MFYFSEHAIYLFLAQLFLIVMLARAGGELFRRLKLPALTAELLIGIALGPSLLGRFFPTLFATLFPADPLQHGMLETVSWVGVLFLLLDTGLEIDFSSAWRQRGNALLIAFSDLVIPMLVAFVPCVLLPESYLVHADKRVIFSLFMAVVMTISAMPVAARIMHELKILKTDMGFLTMSALAVNDIAGWVLFTIIIGLFAKGGFSAGTIAVVLVSTVGFSAFALSLGRILSNKAIDWFQKAGLPEPGTSFTFACLLGLLFGAFTQRIGIHALFGFFIAGIVVGEARNLREESRTVISQMVHSLFVPVFFVNIGLKIDFFANFDLFLVLLITIVGIAGRYIGAWVGVSLSRISQVNKNLISIAHTPGGMMEIVVALLAYESGLITAPVFIAIICSAMASSIFMGPWMRWAMKRRKEVSIQRYLDTGWQGVVITATDLDGAIRHFASNIKRFVKNADTDLIVRQLLEREQSFSTAVGNGIAIPHVRLAGLQEPVIFFGYSREGIDWNSPDGKAVRFIFFLLSPVVENDLHIEILSKIVAVMQAQTNRDALMAALEKGTGADVVSTFFGQPPTADAA